MKDLSPGSPREQDIAAQAAGWVMRRDRGLTPGEQDDFSRWLAADPRHGGHFARLQQAWLRLDQIEHWRSEPGAEPDPDLLVPPARRRVLRWPLALAAAAMVAWALFAVWPRGPGAAVPAPGTSVAVAPREPPVAQDYETRTLPDGSLVEMKPGTAVVVDYTPGERDVRLFRGEAQFTVAKNPNRPFVVTAGGVGVRAVGTAFDVNLSGPAVEVLVTEGRVQVVAGAAGHALARPAASYPIAAGHEATFSSDPAAPPPRDVPVTSAQIEDRLAWRPTLLSFTAAPLAEIVAGFNRHNRVQLVVADSPTGAIKLDLLAFHSNNVDAFVRLLEADYGVRAAAAGDTITLSRTE